MRNAVDHKKHNEEHIKHRNIFVPLVVLFALFVYLVHKLQ